ncbi:hypothetical protein Scep_016983 [Stephania cephalantha]|uniref:6-phosphogluconate dehydrogenase NADP-binding domain-containing protein n=1 Tax=Stephania cephalantha TaxID=152367 RepID=A0AAP0IPL9_9MAGN
MPITTLTRTLLHRTSASPATTLSLLSRTMSIATAAAATEPITPATTRVGQIDKGVMGRSMCSHLIHAGYSLTIFTRTQSKAQPLFAPSPSPNPTLSSPSSDTLLKSTPSTSTPQPGPFSPPPRPRPCRHDHKPPKI